MTWQAWTVVALTVVMAIALLRHWAGPDLVMMAALTVVLALGIVPPERALAGFANEGVLTVAALFAVAAGVRETGALDYVAQRILGRPKRLVTAQLRLMLPISAMSGFLNNTPVVALMIPLVSDWSRRLGLSPSKLLMPLSYAAILGGTCTLIGTSTNLVVAGLAGAADVGVDFRLFDVTPLGLAALISGTVAILLLGDKLLPERSTAANALDEARNYTVAVRVADDAEIIGETIEEAGLRQLPGLFLVELQRAAGDLLVAVEPSTRLAAGDVLVFSGLVESVVDLTRTEGLEAATEQVDGVLAPSPRRRLVEAVVGGGSPLVGQTVKGARFRTRYHAAIVAVHRGGERIKAKIGSIVLAPGDALLLQTHPGFTGEHRHDPSFALVRDVEGSTTPDHRKAPIALVVLVAMLGSYLSGATSLLVSALFAAGVLLATRCLNGAQARAAIDIRVLLTIAASFGIAAALETSGVAARVGMGMIAIGGPFGPAGVLAALFVAAALLASLVGNNAAAAMMFPIALAAAQGSGLATKSCLLVLMVGASASFASPLSYQTNLMVLGPGGYRFGDFVRLGIPVQIAVGVAVVATATMLMT